MRRGDSVYRFGGFELHPDTRRLLRDGQRLALADSASAILVHLITNAPAVLSKDALAKAGWCGIATAGSVEKALSRLRQVLGDGNGGGAIYIETVPNRGYRFVAAVEEVPAQVGELPAGIDDEAFQAFVRGRRALATLNRHAVVAARADFARTLASAPGYAPAHVGLSTARALTFEATRFARACDPGEVIRAVDDAREGVRLNPELADAWSALGFALSIYGDAEAAAVAAVKAVALEPASWRHALRLAYVSWGEERIEAAETALALRPQLALAYWLKATVLVARGAFDQALAQLRDGCAAQDNQPADSSAYPAVGLHLLRGLVLAAQDRLDEAGAAFDAELSAPDRGQLYWQECAANTWYARGAVRLRQRDVAGAEVAFRQALATAPGHLCSLAALGQTIPALAPGDPRAADAGIARAIVFARGNRHTEAVQIYKDTIGAAGHPNAGWILPVEPLLHAAARVEIWRPVLTLLQQRAT